MMKTFSWIIVLIASGLALTSCEHDVSMETTVHEDGSLDKVIRFHGLDSVKAIMNLKESSGWKRNVIRHRQPDSAHVTKTTLEWTKTFASAEEANKELAATSDTLFRVSSTFVKKFRWFYTYIHYADTYHAINRMKLSVEDYVTPEDYAFIDRLPAEGKTISRADSLYLSELNKKLFDVYGLKAVFDEYYALDIELIKKNEVDRKWLDTLSKYKNHLFLEMGRGKEPEEGFALRLLDSLHIPLPYEQLVKQYKEMSKPIESKTNFISTANEGKYVNRIDMPWEIVATNADSIVMGNVALWHPPVTKFLIKDYTMYAEARRMNYWAVALSAALIGLTFYLFLRQRSS